MIGVTVEEYFLDLGVVESCGSMGGRPNVPKQSAEANASTGTLLIA